MRDLGHRQQLDLTPNEEGGRVNLDTALDLKWGGSGKEWSGVIRKRGDLLSVWQFERSTFYSQVTSILARKSGRVHNMLRCLEKRE